MTVPRVNFRMADGHVAHIITGRGKTKTTPTRWELQVTPAQVWPLLDVVSERHAITRSDLVRLALVYAFSSEDFKAGLEEMFGDLDRHIFALIGGQTLTVRSVVRRLLRQVEVVDNGIKARTLWSKWVRLPITEAEKK